MFEQSERDIITGAYRGYYQLVASLGGTYTNFQPYWITLPS